MHRWKSIVGETGGSEVAEAALVLPIFLLLLIGIFWLGRVYNVYATINYAAMDGARTAATRSCASCGNQAYQNDATPVVNVISADLQASRLDITQAQSVPPPAYCMCGDCGTTPSCARVGGAPSSNVCVQFNVQLSSTNGSAGCGVAVTFKYPYNLLLPFVSISQITLQSQAQTVGEF